MEKETVITEMEDIGLLQEAANSIVEDMEIVKDSLEKLSHNEVLSGLGVSFTNMGIKIICDSPWVVINSNDFENSAYILFPELKRIFGDYFNTGIKQITEGNRNKSDYSSFCYNQFEISMQWEDSNVMLITEISENELSDIILQSMTNMMSDVISKIN